jgi:hypothetical protein
MILTAVGLLSLNVGSAPTLPADIVTMTGIPIATSSQSFKPPEEGAPGRREGGGTR